MNAAIVGERLGRQLLTRTGLRRPADVVSWFGAVQAHEYEAAKWALGRRLQDAAVAADIERAFQEGRILRTHVMPRRTPFVTFQYALVIAGQVAGTWRAARGPRGVLVDVVPLRRITRQARAAVVQAVRRYEAFLATPVEFSVK